MKTLEPTRAFRSRLFRLTWQVLALAPVLAFGPTVQGAAAPQGESSPARLSDDAAVGRVVDREGNAARRPVLADRWGPANARARIESGDWFKTGSRGANALSLELAGGATLVLGPGGLVEIAAGDRIVLLRGELSANVPDGKTLTIGGPGDTTIELRERAVFRATDRALTRLDERPQWLVGYEGDASTEALGSLLAKVDGRNVPLTIGYHKVTVDIRDQIARTVIEESFVNHTHTVLEGVFYFPLPAGASISSFGMWIGDEYVPGEIVEKQRAREIYETILRERRDPGLLEWSGGNLFKARVFPIGAEKRIKIAYTQVLPRTDDTFSYHYGLSSELLRKNPLRELQIEVTTASAETLKNVTCPSHECRIRRTDHSARVEFEAEEFAPDRDFELRFEVASNGGELVAIPHLRGDDGYFMMLVNAPAAPVGDGGKEATEPIDLLILADTSGSMYGPARDAQVAFVEALLGTLGEHDTFNLATCDTETRWTFERSGENSADAHEGALRFLEAREPLGWSNLEVAFETVFAAARSHSHVVYVGDGIPTSGAADPVAFAQQLTRTHRGAGTFHAVVPGNRSEQVVLRAIAALGAGSVRSIGGGTDAAGTAFQLMHEISSPALKDLTLQFEGIEVAAVYPERLPNLPAGGQQVIVGRFDPASGATSGKAVLTGTFDGIVQTRTTSISLADSDQGNSFIPRLWARRHLDALLDQGRSAEIKQRIIALSEDYQIITPHTSFLVLESDEDRERFKVDKAFRMRDGEEFFTKGRSGARHELLREQLNKAKSWRRRLHARTLAALATMNRELTELLRGGHGVLPMSETASLGFVGRGGGGGAFDDNRLGDRGRSNNFRAKDFGVDNEESFDDDGWSEKGADPGDPGGPAPMEMSEVDEIVAIDPQIVRDGLSSSPMQSRELHSFRKRADLSRRSELRQVGAKNHGYFRGGRASAQNLQSRLGGIHDYDGFGQLFPSLADPQAAAPEAKWSADVVAILRALDRRATIAAHEGGVSIRVESTYTDARGREQVSVGDHLLSAQQWLVRGAHIEGSAYPIDWCVGEERGTVQAGWWLGRTRVAKEGDKTGWRDPFAWHFGSATRSYVDYTVTALELDDDHTELTFQHPSNSGRTMKLRIDRNRAVVLSSTWVVDGKATSETTFSDHFERAGAWWPGTITTSNSNAASGSSRIEIVVESLPMNVLGERLAEELELRDRSILLADEISDVPSAKQAVKDGEAGFEEHFSLIRYFAASQRWDRAQPHFDALVELASAKPGLTPIRWAFHQHSGRNDELRSSLMAFAENLRATPRECEYALAMHALNLTSALSANEQLPFLASIGPVVDRQLAIVDAKLPWDRQWVDALLRMGRNGDALVKLEEVVVEHPTDASLHMKFANLLATSGEVDRALSHLEMARESHGPWQDYYVTQFRQTSAQILWNSYRLEDFVTRLESWQREAPDQFSASLANQYLSALIFLDREREAQGHIETWLTDSHKDELEPFQIQRMQAAVQHCLGQGYNLYSYRFEEDRAELLADTARVLAALELDHGLVAQIVSQHRFVVTDPGKALVAGLFEELRAGVGELRPERLTRLVRWIRSAGYTHDGDPRAIDEIFEALYERFLGTELEKDREQLGQILLEQPRPELHARVFRRMIEIAPDETRRVAAVQGLFATLMTLPWTQQREVELTGLFAKMQVEGEASSGVTEVDLARRIVALYDLTTWLPRARAEAEVAAIPDVNKLTRRELRAKRSGALRSGRMETATVLQRLETQLTPVALARFATIERVYLDLKTKSRLSQARVRAFELLSALADAHAEAAEGDVPLWDRILAARCAATYSFLLTRYTDEDRADHEPVYQTLLDTNIAADNVLLDWRELKFTLLVALDRAEAIEPLLTKWFGDGTRYAELRWGRDLAYIVAELGRLERAVAIFKDVERADELTHDDYRLLAALYTALDRPLDAREAKIESWQVLGEHVIGNALSNESYAVQRGGGDGIPVELDPEVPLRFIALMRKSASPSNWSWVLQSYYNPTKDFRLLECIPEAVLGRSAQQIYNYLGSIRSFTTTIQEEATVDRLEAHLVGLHDRTTTDVDKRALRLLEFIVLQNATRQANGTEDHGRRALRALEAASRGEWSDGEPRLMAEFLASAGVLAPSVLADERLRQLRALRGAATNGDDRLAISASYARVLWSEGNRELATETLEGALALYRAGVDDPFSQAVGHHLSTLGSWFENLGAFAKAQAMWQHELALDQNVQQSLWLEQSLLGSCRNAVVAKARLSFGVGEALYLAVHDEILAALKRRTNESHASQLVQIATDLWTRSHRDLHYAAASEGATRFAFSVLPEVLAEYQYRSGQNLVGNVAECLRVVRDDTTALEFLTVRAETEPSWLRLQNQDFWSQHSWRFGDLRRRIGTLSPALDTRVFAIVLSEIDKDLASRQARNRSMYDVRNGDFWSEKSSEFQRRALAFLREHDGSGASVVYATEYLFHGLRAHDEAIAALERAYRRDLLDVAGRYQLANFFQHRERWAESVPILVELIRDRPERVEFHVSLMRGYHGMNARDDLVTAHAAAETWFRANDQWNEPVIAALAEGCVVTELLEEAAGHFGEAIALHVKSAPNRGVGDGTLSVYYRRQSRAYSGLGRTDAAVDAAAGAIVSWGGNIHQRAQELGQLQQVLSWAKDLDAYVLRLDAANAESGLENPILRKALGTVFTQKQRWSDAARELRRALDSQPNDSETYPMLVAAYEGMNRHDLAAEAVLQWARAREIEIHLFRDLGDRFAQLERPDDAERAWTQAVEALPEESESHAAFADLLESLGRWHEATDHWRHVIRIRTNEPDGYVRLARAWIQLEEWDAARKVIDEMLTMDWPERFGDVTATARGLLREMKSE